MSSTTREFLDWPGGNAKSAEREDGGSNSIHPSNGWPFENGGSQSSLSTLSTSVASSNSRYCIPSSKVLSVATRLTGLNP